MAGTRILLIEDSVDDAELIAIELEEAGIVHPLHRVELRHELESALEQTDWLLVLCDSRLPGYNGAEAFGWVRARLPDVPFLFCTGGDQLMEAELREAIAAADGHVLKDTLHQLPAAVRRLLDR